MRKGVDDIAHVAEDDTAVDVVLKVAENLILHWQDGRGGATP